MTTHFSINRTQSSVTPDRNMSTFQSSAIHLKTKDKIFRFWEKRKKMFLAVPLSKIVPGFLGPISLDATRGCQDNKGWKKWYRQTITLLLNIHANIYLFVIVCIAVFFSLVNKTIKLIYMYSSAITRWFISSFLKQYWIRVIFHTEYKTKGVSALQ